MTPTPSTTRPQLLEFRGHDDRSTLQELFAGPLARELRKSEQELPAGERRFTSRRWIDYSTRFFERRLLVPLMGAAIYPFAEDRSLLDVSLLGYCLVSLALYALLRRRFSATVSVAVTVGCLLVPPMRDFSFVPMTDSWGILLESCALLSAVLVFDRGPRWLAAWVAVMAAASITRDVTIVPLVGVVGVLTRQRDRQSAVLAATGLGAVLPAMLVFGNTSVRENLAFVFSDFRPPHDDGSGFVVREYWPHFGHLVSADWNRIVDLASNPLWGIAAVLALAGVIALIAKSPSDDPFFRLHRYALLGAALFVALFDAPSGLRQELVFVPPIAVGVALLAERAWTATSARRRLNKVSSAPVAEGGISAPSHCRLAGQHYASGRWGWPGTSESPILCRRPSKPLP